MIEKAILLVESQLKISELFSLDVSSDGVTLTLVSYDGCPSMRSRLIPLSPENCSLVMLGFLWLGSLLYVLESLAMRICSDPRSAQRSKFICFRQRSSQLSKQF